MRLRGSSPAGEGAYGWGIISQWTKSANSIKTSKATEENSDNESDILWKLPCIQLSPHLPSSKSPLAFLSSATSVRIDFTGPNTSPAYKKSASFIPRSAQPAIF